MNTSTFNIVNRHNTKALSKDEPITEENVRFRGERTAIRAVKTLLGRTGGNFMQRVYRDLPRQKEVLDCRMAGMGMAKTAMALSVVKSTVRFSLRYIQMKYHKSFNHISYCPDIKALNLTACENRVVEHYLRGATVLEIACALSVTRQAIERTMKRVQRKARVFGNLSGR